MHTIAATTATATTSTSTTTSTASTSTSTTTSTTQQCTGTHAHMHCTMQTYTWAVIWRKGKADGAKTSLKHGKSTTVRETPTFVIAIHLQHTFGMQFGMRQGEGGPDPEELSAAQVLGHGLRLVFGGLRRRGQRHCLQELELATWVATCGYASSGDLNPPTWLTTQIHPCVETTPRPKTAPSAAQIPRLPWLFVWFSKFGTIGGLGMTSHAQKIKVRVPRDGQHVRHGLPLGGLPSGGVRFGEFPRGLLPSLLVSCGRLHVRPSH